MVSLKSTNDILVHDCHQALLREAKSGFGNDLQRVSVRWILLEQADDLDDVEKIVDSVIAASNSERTYQHVAILGYAVEIFSGREDVVAGFEDGAKWLVQRSAFTAGGPMGFCADESALMGIVLGARFLHSNNSDILHLVGEWMNSFIDISYKMRFATPWQKYIFAVVKKLTGIKPELELPSDDSIWDAKLFFRGRGLLPPVETDAASSEINQALTLFKEDYGKSLGNFRAAIRAASFDYLLREVPSINIAQPSIEQICKFLRNVPSSFRRWTWEEKPRTARKDAEARKWNIDNEYHVQNLLYFLLAPIFPDLSDEEYRPNIGQKHPRTDLVIPSLKLIIEVKFKRKTMSFSDLIEELAADSSLYLTDTNRYSTIIAFVWDDSCQVEQHSTLIEGLKKIPGIVDAVVVSRPGTMNEQPGAVLNALSAKTVDDGEGENADE